MTIRWIHRLGRGMIGNGGSLAGLLLGWAVAGTLSAQQPTYTVEAVPEPSAADASQMIRKYMNKNVIKLPIRINEQSRPMIREIQLYVKDQPNAPWMLRDKVGPDHEAFEFQANRDGEYAFAMRTVDTQGQCIPVDIKMEPPGLVVVIDTQAPQMELKNLGVTQDGQMIFFRVADSNLNSASIRLQYQGGDMQFRPLLAMPGRPNVFYVPAQAVTTGVLHASATDMAGNIARQEINFNQVTPPKAVGTNPPPAAIKVPSPAENLQGSLTNPVPGMLPSTIAQATPIVEPPAGFPNPLTKAVPIEEPSTGPQLKLPAGPEPVAPTPIERVSMRPDGTDGPRYVDGPATNNPTHPVTTIVRSPQKDPVEPPSLRLDQPKRQLVNQSRVYLDYKIEDVGKSGVGKVEVWVTRDMGQRWEKRSETPHGKGSAEVQFPEDGNYGVMLVVTNGRGQGNAPPSSGTSPDWVIDVDTTKPTAQITNLQTSYENGAATVQIGWTTKDKNLGDAPVELYYSATVDGPWLPIAKGLKADGSHRWTTPTNIGALAFLRVQVRDLAGNTAVAGTLEPIMLDDPARPRGVIRAVRTGSPTPE